MVYIVGTLKNHLNRKQPVGISNEGLQQDHRTGSTARQSHWHLKGHDE